MKSLLKQTLQFLSKILLEVFSTKIRIAITLFVGSAFGLIIFAKDWLTETLLRQYHLPPAEWTLSHWLLVVISVSLCILAFYVILKIIQRYQKPFRFFKYGGVKWRYDRFTGTTERFVFCPDCQVFLSTSNNRAYCHYCDKVHIENFDDSKLQIMFQEASSIIHAKVNGYLKKKS